MSYIWEALVIWTWTLRASQRWGSLRGMLKFGKSVTKIVPALSVVWTVSIIACWYSKNLEPSSAILETLGNPFLLWKVRANLTAPKWRWMYPYFFPWNNKFSRESKGNEIFTVSCGDIGLVKFRSLDIFFYSRGLRRANIFFMVFMSEDWGLLNTVKGFTMGKLVIGILLSLGTWEISCK